MTIEFGSCDEPDLITQKCKRLEILQKKLEIEKRKRENPIVKEKDVFVGWKEPPKSKPFKKRLSKTKGKK